MDKQQGMEIVERLRRAAGAGAPVVELIGDDAKNFAFVRDRSAVLGSFSIEAGKKFFVSVASSSSSADAFQLLVYDKPKANPVLASSYVEDGGILWTYQAAKQSGDNQARKKAFLDLASAPSLTIPLPDRDVTEFSHAVQRAIELRSLADAAGGTDVSDDPDDTDAAHVLAELYPIPSDRTAAARVLGATIRLAHSINPRSWCVTNPGGNRIIRLNVGVVSVLDLLPGAVRLGVDATQLDATARVSLGPALHVDEERLPPFDGSGAVTVALSDIPALDPDVLGSHEAFVRLAAPTPSPFARHHQPEILTAVAAQLDEPLPRPAAAQVRYWKVSPGEKGEMWEECRDGGFIAIGWDKLGDLTGIDHDEFKVRADALDASEQVWKFRNIEVGDRVVANAGTTRVLGIGTVTGAYYYGTGKKRAHRLPVRWDDTTERAVEMKGWRSTLIRLKQDTFSQVESAPPVGHATPRGTRGTSELRPLPDDAGPEGGIDFEGILSELSSKSLSFSAELVASYLLALQAKRFVLLTGISGTGKTRLAQEIARIFGPPMAPTPVMDDSFEITTKPSQRKYGRFVVPAELAQEFEALSDPDQKRIDLEVPGVPMASMAIHKNAQGGNLLYVLLSGQQRQWFQTNLQVGDRFLLARRTKGDREWLELRLPDTAQPARPPAGATYELIAVRPDWTDARALLGFHNPLTRIYLSTPALQVLLRAQAEVDATVTGEAPRPFFLVFDEMNLARVEHYFSDFLSAMESGESIHLHDDVEVEESQNIPRRMTIPRNVFVVGTVNVDETTYMFSPKVLDRSFVLEFNEVDLDGLGGTIRVEEPDSTPLALVRMQDGLKLRGPATDAEWQRFESALGGVTSSTLRKLHAALAIDNRHFGYRVAREVARFVDLAMEQTAGTPEAVHAALDVAVLAKILPKLHGSQAELEQTLKRLMSIAIDDRPEIDVFSVDGVLAPDANVSLPRTARKLWRMQRRLRAHGFVSFIE